MKRDHKHTPPKPCTQTCIVRGKCGGEEIGGLKTTGLLILGRAASAAYQSRVRLSSQLLYRAVGQGSGDLSMRTQEQRPLVWVGGLGRTRSPWNPGFGISCAWSSCWLMSHLRGRISSRPVRWLLLSHCLGSWVSLYLHPLSQRRRWCLHSGLGSVGSSHSL